MSDLQERAAHEDDKAHRCDVRARLERRNGNRAMMALWELYAKQARAEANMLRNLDVRPVARKESR